MHPFKAAFATIAVSMVLAGTATAEQLFAYPTKGQSPEQQRKDNGECHGWAVQQSGFDPAAPREATGAPPPPPQQPTASPLRGAARGAAVGAVGGAIAGDAGKGAAIGAATGGLIGGMRRRDQRQHQQAQQQHYQQQQQAALTQGQSAFNRAFAACMQGRGYTVQ
jgi:hypothetical protein